MRRRIEEGPWNLGEAWQRSIETRDVAAVLGNIVRGSAVVKALGSALVVVEKARNQEVVMSVQVQENIAGTRMNLQDT